VRIDPFVGADKATLADLYAHRIPGPRLVTIAKRPSSGPGRREMCF
jgi:hypothetical protein